MVESLKSKPFTSHDSRHPCRLSIELRSCAVALPAISEDGPHISIRKQATEAMTPVDLVEHDSISTELVALCWLLYEHRGVVLFSGPTGVGKTTLMNAYNEELLVERNRLHNFPSDWHGSLVTV